MQQIFTPDAPPGIESGECVNLYKIETYHRTTMSCSEGSGWTVCCCRCKHLRSEFTETPENFREGKKSANIVEKPLCVVVSPSIKKTEAIIVQK